MIQFGAGVGAVGVKLCSCSAGRSNGVAAELEVQTSTKREATRFKKIPPQIVALLGHQLRWLVRFIVIRSSQSKGFAGCDCSLSA